LGDDGAVAKGALDKLVQMKGLGKGPGKVGDLASLEDLLGDLRSTV